MLNGLLRSPSTLSKDPGRVIHCNMFFLLVLGCLTLSMSATLSQYSDSVRGEEAFNLFIILALIPRACFIVSSQEVFVARVKGGKSQLPFESTDL